MTMLSAGIAAEAGRGVGFKLEKLPGCPPENELPASSLRNSVPDSSAQATLQWWSYGRRTISK